MLGMEDAVARIYEVLCMLMLVFFLVLILISCKLVVGMRLGSLTLRHEELFVFFGGRNLML